MSHSHETCKYSADGIVLQRLSGSREMAIERANTLKPNENNETSIFARAVSYASQPFFDELMKQLKYKGIKSVCVRGGFDKLYKILQENNHGIEVTIHTEDS